jgi:hypothetical protein
MTVQSRSPPAVRCRRRGLAFCQPHEDRWNNRRDAIITAILTVIITAILTATNPLAAPSLNTQSDT